MLILPSSLPISKGRKRCQGREARSLPLTVFPVFATSYRSKWNFNMASTNLVFSLSCVSSLICPLYIDKNFVDVVIMMIFGMLGYLCRKFDLNTAAIVLVLILDPIGEKNLRRSLALSGGGPGILFSMPVC